MNKFALIAILTLSTGIAHADFYKTRAANGTVSFSDRSALTQTTRRIDRNVTRKLVQLSGEWHATSHDGRSTTMTLRENGSFVIDQRSDVTAHRVYMCGEWQGAKRALNLTVKADKRMSADGVIEQAASTYQGQAPILSARADRIIVLFEGEQLVFDRG